MSRKLLPLAIFVASFSILLGSPDAEAKKYHVRNVNYRDCSHQHVQHMNYHDCGYRHVRHVNYRDCEYQQVRHVNYRDCGHLQVQHVVVGSCHTPRPTCCEVRPSCGIPVVQANCATPQPVPAAAPAPAGAY